MSSPFAYLLSAARRADKAAKKLAQGLSAIDERSYDDIYNQCLETEFRSVTREIKLMQRLKEYIKEDFDALLAKPAIENTKGHWYLITIRPANDALDFNVFRAKIEEFLTRKCFLDYNYSFEQKSTDMSKLGTGYHVHIVASMKQASKGNVLRDTLSSFKSWIDKGYVAPNCIDVRPVSNPEEFVQKYLIDYVSEDEHKQETMKFDVAWRTFNNIRPIYSLHACPSSPGTCVVEELN